MLPYSTTPDGRSKVKTLFISILIALIGYTSLSALDVRSVEKFMDNAALDGWNSTTNEILFMRKDKDGTVQLYKVREDAREPEKEKVCLSCSPLRAIGVPISLIPLLHKGNSDWHPSGEWFITQMEVPNNFALRQIKRVPGTRSLAEPGAGWWNNLFLVKTDGSAWIRLTNFSARDTNSGVLCPKFSRDGRMVAWAERTGGSKPFDKYPFGQWVLKTAKIEIAMDGARLFDEKIHPVQGGATFEPLEWSQDNKLLFATDGGYSDLPYPGYRLDLWEADTDKDGTLKDFRNITKTKGFYEGQASYSPDGKFVALAANLFDGQYEERLSKAWKKDKDRFSHFIIRNLSTELYLMDRGDKTFTRLTRFVESDWKGKHPLVTRSGWSKDGRTLFVGLTLRSNITGKIEEEMIYKIKLE